MSYILTNVTEDERLNTQSLIPEFSIDKELSSFNLNGNLRILDAGCGSGILTRFLEKNYPGAQIFGCDLSESSLKYANENKLLSSSKFFSHDLAQPLKDRYDVIINRLVFHHLDLNLSKTFLKNFKDALSKNGKLIIVDIDGLFINLGTSNQSLLSDMKKVTSFFHGNLSSIRYVPEVLKELCFKNIQFKIETMNFQNESRKLELEQWKQRFQNSIEFYVKIFGSVDKANDFFTRYINEARKEFVPLFYNKFIISADK